MLFLLALPTALAGERTFAFSYGYGTVPKGGVEVEHYATVALPEEALPSWEHQIELEYGISNRLEAGLYVLAAQEGGGPLAYAGHKARLKYRFGAEGVGPVDAAAYLEYEGAASLEEHAVEGKLILAKDVKRFVSALNLEYKATFEEEGEIEHELEPTLGLGVRAAPWVTIGAEGKVEVEFEEDEAEVLGWVGPSVHLAGAGGKVWWTLAALLPLTEETREHDGVVVRSLVAINL